MSGQSEMLTPEQAKQAGYSGYAQHMAHVPCPRRDDPRIYCVTCQGALAYLLGQPETRDEQFREAR